MPDLALSSPDGESRRPVGKVEGRGYPKGKLAVGGVLLVTFLSLLTKLPGAILHAKRPKGEVHGSAQYRKVTRPAGRNQMLGQARNKQINND
jgi:hypothetical protein